MRRFRVGICLWLLAAAFAAASAFAERQPYDRYRSIVDRQMFGPLPEGFDPTKSPAEVSRSSGAAADKELSKEQEKVKSAIRFSVINVTPDGETAVGFTDNGNPKAPVHYYMKRGESRNGWEVKEADAATATMTVVKDGVEVTLSLGGDSSKSGGSPQPAGGLAGGAQRSPILGSLGARRRARMEREAADMRAAAQREAEENEKREAEEKAREAERAAERAEQRQQLLAIQEELRKVREERQAQKEAKTAEDDGSVGP